VMTNVSLGDQQVDILAVFKRNLAGALFYSGPEQRNLRLENTIVSDIETLKTNMVRARFKGINFSRVNQDTVTSEHSIYQSIDFTESEVNDWKLSNCEVSMNLVDTDAHLISAVKSKFMIHGRRARVEDSQFEKCDVV